MTRACRAGLPQPTTTRTFRSRTYRSGSSNRSLGQTGAVAAVAAGYASGTRSWTFERLSRTGLLTGGAQVAARAAAAASLNGLFEIGPGARRELRQQVCAALTRGAQHQHTLEALLHPVDEVSLSLPATVGDYTDFYAGNPPRHHGGRHVPPEQPAAAELPMGADRISRPGVDGSTQRTSIPSAQRSGKDTGRSGTDLPAQRPTGLRARARSLDRTGKPTGTTDSHRAGRLTRRRILPAERLVHPGCASLGIPVAGTVPLQELRHHFVDLGHYPGGSRPVPNSLACPARGGPRPCHSCGMSAISAAPALTLTLRS